MIPPLVHRAIEALAPYRWALLAAAVAAAAAAFVAGGAGAVALAAIVSMAVVLLAAGLAEEGDVRPVTVAVAAVLLGRIAYVATARVHASAQRGRGDVRGRPGS